MKIWSGVPKVFGNYDNKKSVGRVDKTAGVASKKDVVSISTIAKDIQTGLKAVKEIPDVRSEKVNGLTDRYEAGNYDVSGKDIADRVVKSMLDSRV